MFFDSHCHLDRIDLDGHNHSFPQLLETIRADQVTRMMCISVDLEQLAETTYANANRLFGLWFCFDWLY